MTVGGMLWPAAGSLATVAAVGATVASLIVVAGLASRLLRSATMPVDQLIDAAGRVQAGDYAARVSESGPAELRSLARAFNQMSERLERTDAQRRSFMADVSHELRTPLSVIQGQLEAIRDGVYPADSQHLAPALDQVAVLERLVDDLRTLSLSESGSLRIERESVDLGVLVMEVVESFRAAAESAGVSLSTHAATDLPRAWLDPARISGVMRNLVANALRHTPAGARSTRPWHALATPSRCASTTPAAASTPRSCPPCSSASAVRPTRVAAGSGWPSREPSSRPMAGPSPPRASRARAPR
ncbi:MAG: histidine kinase dimerization/phospho-acceptor domain-containing protein [Chloroflexota bacterium]